ERRDEIGDSTRVMNVMNAQIRDHIARMEKSEAELRLLNRDLAASESKYRSIVDHAPFGIFTTKGMALVFSNRYNKILAGLDPDKEGDLEAIQKAIHPEDRDRVLTEFAQAVEQGRPYETVFRFLHQDGTVRKVLSRRIPIRDADGRTLMYQGFNVDITALEQMQARLSRAERLATLGQMAAGIAHELRNPLVGIGSTASLLLDEFERSDPRRAEIDVILHETKRMDRIVNQIVEYARPRELALAEFVLSELINEILKLLNGPLQAKHIKIRTSLAATADHLHADRDQIEQVLLNVIDNAVDASPMDGSVIEITAHELFHQEQPGIMIQVRD